MRRLEILDGEQYSKDMAILWAAYKAGSFSLPEDLGQGDFVGAMEKQLSGYQSSWIVDDDTKVVSSGRAPVAMVCANSVGLVIEPVFAFFKWATRRNVLRVAVSFLNMIKHSKKTGIALIRANKDQVTLPDHLKRYDLLYFLGKCAEDEYLYSIRGRGTDG